MTATRSNTASGTSPDVAPSTRSTIVLITVLVGQFMAVLDLTISNVAAPAIGADLNASGATLQLVVSGYTISYAALLVCGARLGDRLGHARMFRAGLAAFTVFSLLCGLAPTTGVLIAARFLQGVGAALMMPQVMSLIQRLFTGPARARALSLYGAVIAVAGVVGQVLGGVLVSVNIAGSSWRPTFLLNVPVGAALLVLAARSLPRDAGNPSRRLDVPGTVVLGAAVTLFVVPLVLGHDVGWPAWTFVALAGSAVAAGMFVLVERRVERYGGSPIMSRTVMRAPGLTPGAGAIVFYMAGYGGFLFALALYLQDSLGYPAWHTGLLFAPAGAAFAVGGLTWQRLPAAMHRTLIPVALLLGSLGYLGLAPLLHGGARVGAGYFVVMTLLGLVLGAAFSPLVGRVLQHVAPQQAADASGVLVTALQLGQVIGVSVLGTVYLQLSDGRSAAHAVAITLVIVAGCVLAAAGCAARVVRVQASTRP